MEYKFKRNFNIGSLDAESDKFLVSAFVEKDDLSLLKDIEDPKCILMGRTGSGKSALICHLEKNEDNVVRIAPENMSLRHLSNSNIINYFKNLDVKLDLFYKVLWKHVFIVELIKLHFHNSSKTSYNIEWLKEKLSFQKRKKAIAYLEKWEDKFWEETEYRIKELETSLENRFKSSMGINFDIEDLLKGDIRLEEEDKKSEKIKYDIINKAQKVINESQIEEIQQIIDMLRTEVFSKTSKKYIILIDDLDKEWVSNKIVYDLIKALIETIKEFRVIPNVKIVIALRSNIHKKIFKENTARGVQREKYNNLYLNIEWSKDELNQLINNRLKELMKTQYSNTSPCIDDILPPASKKVSSGFDYMLERTFMRPRDIIDFFNKCIKHADGQTKISREIIKLAENDYSDERLKALNDEWMENYGNLSLLYGFLKQSKPNFIIKDIQEIAVDYFANFTEENTKSMTKELKALYTEFTKDVKIEKFLKSVLIVLYEVGLLGIKISPESKFEYIFDSANNAHEIEDISENSKFCIHPMFYQSLRIKVDKSSFIP